MKLTLPAEGIYESTTPPGMRFVVSNVVHVVDEDDGGADSFMLDFIDEASANDADAMGDELMHFEWFPLVEQYGLTYKGPHQG